MRSDYSDGRDLPPLKAQPPQTPRESVSGFLYGALVAAVVMLLIAASLYAHSFQTRAWLAQVRVQAAARASAAAAAKVTGLKTDGCPDSQPVLVGFDADGKPHCRALGSQTCGDGQYIAAIDPFTLQVRCADAGGEISCPMTSYIDEFMWLGEGKTSFSCAGRLDPFVAWKFEPILGSKGND